MVCKDTEEESNLLCYPKCREGYVGIGPVCWGICDLTTHIACGALCIEIGTGTCTSYITDTVNKGMATAADIASGAASGSPDMKAIMSDATDLAQAFVFDICPAPAGST